MNEENLPESLSVDLPNCIRSRELCQTPSSVELPPCQCCFNRASVYYNILTRNTCDQNGKCQEMFDGRGKCYPMVLPGMDCGDWNHVGCSGGCYCCAPPRISEGKCNQDPNCQEKFDGRGKCYATVQTGMDCVRGLCPHPYSKEGCYCCASRISEGKCNQDPNCSQQFEGLGRGYPMSQEGLTCHKDLNVLCAQTGCKCCQPPCETSKECFMWGQSQGFKEGGKCIDLGFPPTGLSMCAKKDMCNPKSPSDTLINKKSKSKQQCWCCV